jgi:hypothetical protein
MFMFALLKQATMSLQLQGITTSTAHSPTFFLADLFGSSCDTVAGKALLLLLLLLVLLPAAAESCTALVTLAGVLTARCAACSACKPIAAACSSRVIWRLCFLMGGSL